MWWFGVHSGDGYRSVELVSEARRERMQTVLAHRIEGIALGVED